ncbi:MAG: CpXC domain-containing protein [Porphyromonadaceae bacterium]|nr:CpXC domain-containing protein [Porphyromonadaceae bacterium]
MSEIRTITIKCPYCHAKRKMNVWSSVNVDLNPELREKVFSGELFAYRCPCCGKMTRVDYDMLYHDMTHHFMLFYEACKPDDFNYKPLDIPSLPGTESYIFRHVTGIRRLREKILILEKGLDDIAIERWKYMYAHFIAPELAENRREIFFRDVIHSDNISSDRGTMVFLYQDENERTIKLSVPMIFYYNHCLACKIDPRMKVETCMNIDEGWMALQLKHGTV